MSAHRIEPGGNVARRRGDVRPPALGVAVLWPRSVSQGGGRLARFYRAIEWDYARLWLGVFATVFVLVYVAKVRGR